MSLCPEVAPSTDYVRFISAAMGCYDSSEVIVMLALPRRFPNCVEVLPAFRDRPAIGSGRGCSPR